MKTCCAGLAALALGLSLAPANDTKSEPPAALVLGAAQASATPHREGSGRTGGGNIHVSQPSPDTISVTMTGAALAKAHPWKQSAAQLTFELCQDFEVVFSSPKVKKAQLALWGRTVGMLRSGGHHHGPAGSASLSIPGHASVRCGPAELLSVSLPARGVGTGESLSVYDREGPAVAPVAPGKYQLRQTFGIAAVQDRGLFAKPVSAEFAPDPALESGWLGQREPFHGADKKTFGFQVILKVIAEEENGEKDNK
jgi:hypothetical protein